MRNAVFATPVGPSQPRRALTGDNDWLPRELDLGGCGAAERRVPHLGEVVGHDGGG